MMADSERAAELLDLDAVMSTKNGRAVIRRLINVAGTNTDTFSKDAHTHAYNAGKRSQGLWLQNEVSNHLPDLYLQMLKEEEHE